MAGKPRVTIVLGTRPEAIKLAPVIQEFQACQLLETRVVLTGQHREMVTQVMDLFGLKADEVEAMKQHYDPQSYIDNDPDLHAVIELLESGHFNLFEPNIFHDILASLRSPHDNWLTLADFRSYVDCQEKAAANYRDRESWVRKSILNTASSGYFSTDRTMQEYNDEIWKL